MRPLRAATRLALALLAPLVAAPLAGCAGAPPVAVSWSLGSVRARTLDDALAAREELERARERLPLLAPDVRPRPVEVWIDAERPSRLGDAVSGATFAFATPRVMLFEGARAGTLEHELVHAWLGPSWEPLPQAVLEGLADNLAARARDRAAASRTRLGRWAQVVGTAGIAFQLSWLEDGQPGGRKGVCHGELLGAAVGPPGLTPSEVLALPRGEELFALAENDASYAYGLGFFLVERILERGGVRRLEELCERARGDCTESIPADWLWRAAGFEPPVGAEAVAREARAGFPEVVEAFVWSDPDFLRLLDELSSGHADRQSFLAARAPLFAVDPGGMALLLEGGQPLATRAGFERWAAARWPPATGP